MSKKPSEDLMVTPPPRLARQSTDKGSVVPAADMDRLHASVSRVATVVNKSVRYTEQIPEIRRRVDATSDKVIELSTKMDGTTDRVTKIEYKIENGHQCEQEVVISELKEQSREYSQKIELDVQRGIKRSGEIAALKGKTSTLIDNVDDIRKAPRRMLYGLIGVIVTIMFSAGGALWFIAELNKDVEFEREQRKDQFGRIEKHMRIVGSKVNTTPMKKAIQSLEQEIEEGKELEFNEMCEDMSNSEKRFMKRVLYKRGKRIPVSCL